MKEKVIDLTFKRILPHEGFVSKPYIDPLRKNHPERYGITKKAMDVIVKFFDKLVITFGYGFTYITEEEGQAVLRIRLSHLYDDLKRIIPSLENHPEEIQSVFLEMLYQLGEGTLRKFKNTLRYLELAQYDKVADEMLDSHWARIQTPKRANQLADIVRKYA